MVLLTLFLLIRLGGPIEPTFGTRISNTPAEGRVFRPNGHFTSLIKDQCQLKAVVCDSIRMIPDKWFALDKVYHLVVSFSLVGSSYHLLANRIKVQKSYSTASSIGGVFALGITKELYDASRPEDRFSYRDLIYDILGIGIGYFVFIH